MRRRTQLVALIGLPASGKSTAARAWVAEDPEHRLRVGRDDMRAALVGQQHPGVLDPRLEAAVSAAMNATVREALNQGLSVVVDATNLPHLHPTGCLFNPMCEWEVAAVVTDSEMVHWNMPAGEAECIRRDAARKGRRVGEAGIREVARWARAVGVEVAP